MRAHRAAPVLGLAPLLVLVAAVGLAPFGTALYDSFFHDVYGTRSPAGLDNYRLLLGDRGLALSLGISLAWAGAHVALTMALSLPVASRLSRKDGVGRVLFLAVLVPWAMPPYIAAAIWRALVHGGWGGSLLSAVLPVRVNLLTSPLWAVGATLSASVWISFPTTVFLLLAAMAATPSSLLEAARVDGAKERELDRWVRLPAALPAAGAAAALDFLRALREVTVILVMTRGGPPLRAGVTESGIVGATTTLEVYLYELFARTPDLGVAAAGALLVAALGVSVLGAYLLFDRPGGHPPRASRRGMPRGSPLLWGIGSRVALALAVASSALVLFSLLRLSFSGLSAVFFDTLVPRYPTARAYRAVLLEEGLLRSLANTLIVALPVALAVPAVTLPAAAALWGWRRGGRPRGGGGGGSGERSGTLAVVGVQLLGLVTGMHAIVPLYLLVRRLGLVGSAFPIVVVYTAHAAPFALLALRAAFRSLPASLAEAARAEGMGPWSYLVRVLVPVLAPVLLVVGAVGFLGAWNGFLVPLVFLTDDARYPVSVKLFSLVGSIGSGSPRWNLFAAGSVVNLVVVGLLTAAVRRPMAESVLSLGTE